MKLLEQISELSLRKKVFCKKLWQVVLVIVLRNLIICSQVDGISVLMKSRVLQMLLDVAVRTYLHPN